MHTPIPAEPTLAEYISRFKVDSDLAHIFVQGNKYEEVVTTSGTYPTIAKMVEDNRLKLQSSLLEMGFAARTYSFVGAVVLHVKHNMRSTRFTESIYDSTGGKLFAAVEVIDNSEFVVTFTEPQTGSVTVVFCTNT